MSQKSCPISCSNLLHILGQVYTVSYPIDFPLTFVSVRLSVSLFVCLTVYLSFVSVSFVVNCFVPLDILALFFCICLSISFVCQSVCHLISEPLNLCLIMYSVRFCHGHIIYVRQSLCLSYCLCVRLQPV